MLSVLRFQNVNFESLPEKNGVGNRVRAEVTQISPEIPWLSLNKAIPLLSKASLFDIVSFSSVFLVVYVC